MIEERVDPFRRSMAIRADFAEIARMVVVFHVARDTFGLGSVKHFIFAVAIGATHFLMTAAQRESRQVVIKTA